MKKHNNHPIIPSCVRMTFVLFLLALGTTATAQHFEWAKGYGSSANDMCGIVGTVADPEGNLYILGDFHPDAEWDGVPLLPMTPYGPNHDTRSVVVAKISPSGEMLWKKVIHGNNGNDALANDIRMLGDTAIAFMARYSLPSQLQRMYLYYLDTLYTNEEEFVHDLSHMALKITTAYIVLDLDGNVLEEHALNVTFVDRDGNDVMHEYTDAIYGLRTVYENDVLWNLSFDFDQTGNMYLCRWANDRVNFCDLDLENGDLSAVKLWVDDRVAGVMNIPEGTRYWFPQLIKLSPHLDTVLGSRYLVQKGRSGIPYTENLVKCRQNGDVYVIWNIPDTRNFTDTIVCDSVQGIQFKLLEQDNEIGFLCAYDSTIKQKWGITIDRDTILLHNARVSNSWRDVCFDEDSNLIFLSSKLHENTFYGNDTNYMSILSYDGVQLPSQKTSAIILKLRERENDIPELVGFGKFPSIYASGAARAHSKGNIGCKNNRLFWQASAQGGFIFPSQTIEFDGGYGESSIGLVILDYQMNLIEGFDIESHSPNSESGLAIIKDSNLYIINYVSDAHAQFGNITFHGNPSIHYAVVAKYVDTAFMTPYIAPVITSIPNKHDITPVSIYPNPANDRVQIDLNNEVLLTASALSMLGQQTVLGHNDTSVDVSPLAPGIYIMEIHTSKKDYKCKFIKY